MAKLTDNKSGLQALITSLQEKINSSGDVTSVNGKTGDVVIELSDFNMTTKSCKLKLEDGSTITKKVVIIPLISFTIDGTTYYAEEGMTWGEWVDSEYNTNNGFKTCEHGWVMGSMSEHIVVIGDSLALQKATNIILDSTIYATNLGGSVAYSCDDCGW